MTAITKRSYFSGLVQGVGFRAQTMKIAQSFPVSGYVRNLRDGRVEILSQGTSTAVEEFLKAVRTFLQAYIEGVETEDAPWESHEGFTILN